MKGKTKISMTCKERIKAVINNESVEIIPYHICLTQKVKKRIADYYNIDKDLVNSFIGNHLCIVSLSAPEDFVPVKVGENLIKDEFGATWNTKESIEVGDWGIVDHPVKNIKLGGYKFPSPIGQGRFRGVEKVIEQNPGRFNVLRMPGIFDVAWHVCGMQNLLMGMAIDPKSKFTNWMLDSALEYNIGILEQLPSYIKGVRFIEDWGQQKGLIMGLKHWKRFLKPRLKEMYQVTKKKGCAVFTHSCGDITELFPDLIEMGVDVIDPIQPEVMDLNFIKKEYGRDVVLFGGVGCQSTIPLGTPEQVVQECKEKLSLLGEGGKYIFGPSGSVSNEVPIENIIALIKFCKRMNLYF